MSLLDCTISIKKFALVCFLMILGSNCVLTDVPAEAQLNPRPSIFKEYPYRRASKRKIKHRSNRSNQRPKAKPRVKSKQGAVHSNRRTPFTRVQKKSPNEPLTIEFRAPGYPKSR
jgi:hypothetical protein